MSEENKGVPNPKLGCFVQIAAAAVLVIVAFCGWALSP